MSFLSSIAKITDYMYLCGERAITRTRLNKLGITDVVNCTLDVPNRMDPGIKCVQISIPDRPFSQLDVHFDRVSDLIHKVHSRGGKVLVHCVAGVSRSATLCIAYLMKHQNMTLFDAHHFVWTQRKIVRPNPGFWKQLIAYERKIHGRNTVKMVNSIVGSVPNIYLM
ncbi:K14165 [Mytilus edulis]|uniref:protein-serine/threonine phosphatase n=1 Tax=Mytilus edulis TaxID=6550 RepID=A0A8S3VSH9_MYTED|nr:K14165 [Mytilus edulis]